MRDFSGQRFDILGSVEDTTPDGWIVCEWEDGSIAPVFASNSLLIGPNHLMPVFTAEGDPAGDWIDLATGQRAHPAQRSGCRLLDSDTGEVVVTDAPVEVWWASTLAGPEGHVQVDRNGMGTFVPEGGVADGTLRRCHVEGCPDIL